MRRLFEGGVYWRAVFIFEEIPYVIDMSEDEQYNNVRVYIIEQVGYCSAHSTITLQVLSTAQA